MEKGSVTLWYYRHSAFLTKRHLKRAEDEQSNHIYHLLPIRRDREEGKFAVYIPIDLRMRVFFLSVLQENVSPTFDLALIKSKW
jgi:hypothetical protein